jgi:short-subunit dehydrogenase
MDLTNTVVLVTGANRGIGRAIVAELARRPVLTILAGVRDPSAYEAPSTTAGGAREIRAVAIDLGSQDAIEKSLGGLGDDLPRIDVLVNNAGAMTGGLLEEQDIDEVYAMFQVNLAAVAHMSARVLPGMLERGRGKIVNNTSISGYAYFPAASTYAASKAGVVALSESLRRELEGTGVDVLHLVTPGVKTDMLAATEEVYGRHMDTSGWTSVEPDEWARRVVEAMEDDKSMLAPGGRLEVARVLSRGPAKLLDVLSARMYQREPRG